MILGLSVETLWIPSSDTIQKALLEEWERVNGEQSHVLGEDKAHRISRTTVSEKLQRAGKDAWNTTRDPPGDVPLFTKVLVASSWRIGRTIMELHGDSGKRCIFGNHWAHHSSSEPRLQFYVPKTIRPFSRTINILPYPGEEILPGFEEDVSSIRDGFSAWVKTGLENTLRRHIVDVKGAYAAFREAPARKHSTSCQEYHFNNDMPNRLTEQKRLSANKLEPSAWKRRSYRKTYCGEVARHHPAKIN